MKIRIFKRIRKLEQLLSNVQFGDYKYIKHEIPQCYLEEDCKVIFHHHKIGIVINENAILEDKVQVYQNVTIGSNTYTGEDYSPHIKSGAIIFANSVIAGKTVIGKNSVIGAGSVVIDKVIGDNEVWAGNPARFIRKVK